MIEAFDASMFPHGCYILPRAGSTDDDAGAIEGFPSPGPATPCRARYTTTRSGAGGLGDVGITQSYIAFPANPGVRLDDRIQVVGGETSRVLAPAKPRDAGGFLWVVAGEVVD